MKLLSSDLRLMRTLLYRLLLFSLLTLLTQVGGLLYLLYLPMVQVIKRRVTNKTLARGIRFAAFCTVYMLGSWLLISPLARLNGRVPMPVFSEAQLQPANYFYVLANRHFVQPELRAATIEVAKQMGEEVTLYYLDAGFPFIDGFPLLPHRSHDDGQKLDLAFIYHQSKGQELLEGSPSWLGYGYLEKPRSGESNQPLACKQQGYWHYSLLSSIVPQDRNYTFSEPLNRKLLLKLSAHPSVDKIFIEPHLKSRLGLSSRSNIRFHGCAAVRHDDHIHIQL